VDGGFVVQPDDLAPCLGGGNVLVLDGDSQDLIHPGYEMLHVPYWQVDGDVAKHQNVWAFIGDNHTKLWYLDFDTRAMNVPLVPGAYPGAQRSPFEAAGLPGLEVSGNGACDTLTGEFWIHDIAWDSRVDFNEGAPIARLAATFVQHCDDQPAALRACIYYEKPDAGDAGASP
jgi:hypothetical protein